MIRHPESGVLVGGSVFKNEREGLILQSDGKELSAALIPKVQDVDDFAFTSRDVGWRLYAGTLYTSNHGGTCWRKAFRRKGLNNLHFIDAQHGWLTGLGGIIYHTDDAGASWRRQDSGTDLDLQKLQFIDPLNGWAIGKKAQGDYPPKWKKVLIGTRNGGKIWEILGTEKTFSLSSFSFVNSSEGWGTDTDENIVHTVDGGRTWTVQRVADKLLWTSTFFISDRQGWVCGDGILYTDDGGRTWTSQMGRLQPKSPLIEDVLFTDSQHGWAMKTQQLLYTMNGGQTWDTVFQDPRLEERGQLRTP
jgi:photosystem II stability/assembly factor-like uncharacterized protein